MDARRLLTYRAVARRRSFSQAARDLALSQPSVSQQVGALERELGTRLLERRPGGLRLTHAGTVLLEHADAIAERLELAGVSPERDVYALLPPGGRHPLAEAAYAALAAAAGGLASVRG